LIDTEYKLRLGEIQYDRSETGNGNKFSPIIGTNEISTANTMFCRVTCITERRLILNDICVKVKSNMDAQKPEEIEFI
jgi:hypothetical protein